MTARAEKQNVDERLNVKYINASMQPDIPFTFVTLLARQDSYERLLISAETKGFTAENTQFLALDNRDGNLFDGYDAIRTALVQARGLYIVFTHDDVEFIADGAADLKARLEELEVLDPDWLVAGNAGGISCGAIAGRQLALHLNDPYGEAKQRVTEPVLVESLDENFFIIRRDRPLVNSYDLQGFHLYASDLCRIAEILGGRSYVIPFLLRHHSGGQRDTVFKDSRHRFYVKYRRYFPMRKLRGTTFRLDFGMDGLNEAENETPKSRWDFLKQNVYTADRDRAIRSQA